MPETIKTAGTIIKWNAVEVAETNSVGGLSTPSGKIAIPSFADTVMKYRPGRRKTGDFTFDVNFNQDDTSQAALKTDQIAGTERTVVLKLAEGTLNTITFTARVKNITLSADDDNIYKSQLTLRITSVPAISTT